MKLLTFHGTLLRLAGGRPISHGPLSASGYDAAALDPAALAGTGVEVEAAAAGPWVHLRVGVLYLRAEPDVAALQANVTEPDFWASFLPVPDADAAVLGRLLSFAWRAEGARDDVLAEFLPYFRLRLGDRSIDLAVSRPEAAADGGILFPSASPFEAPWRLRQGRLSRALVPLRGADRTEARAPALAALRSVERLTPPVFLSAAEAGLFHHRFWQGAPFLGDFESLCEIRRAPDKFVLLSRLYEGIIFDSAGTYSEAGYLNERFAPFPAGLRLDLDTLCVERGALEAAPVLEGPHVVSFNPHLTNYYHWLVESLLALDVMRPFLPGGTKLLLPPAISARAPEGGGLDHAAMLGLLGFDDMEMSAPEGAVCRLEDAIWLEGFAVNSLPGKALRAFRDRISARLGEGRRPHRRIYVQRRGSLRDIVNGDEVEAFAVMQGFSLVRLEHMSVAAQISLFQEAEFVMGTHGAGFSNLLFCAAGTRVIEFSPDVEFRPFYWLIGEKLGLHYGVLPCAMTQRAFNSEMVVDLGRLRALLGAMQG
jgi:hypothetical protein